MLSRQNRLHTGRRQWQLAQALSGRGRERIGDRRDRRTLRGLAGTERSFLRPIDQLECYCTTTSCGAGMLDAGATVMAAATRSR